MKKLIIIILGILLIQQFTGSQWVLQNSGTNQILENIHFVNENTGWIIGLGSTILKTTNGGTNWFPQQSNLSSLRNLFGIDMLNADTGYIVGWFSAILKTTNGGVNWIVLREMPSGQGNSYNDVDFVNEQTGWFCGFQGFVWKTTNGGVIWDSVNVGAGGPLRNIRFLNSQTGWVAGDVGFLRKTTNGGANWFFQFFGTTSDYWYNSLQFINDNTGWVAGYNTIVFGTTDGGNNWDTLSLVNGICLHFINSMTGWTGSENGAMYKTTNGGYNFYPQTYQAGGGFVTDIFFINDTTGWSTSVFQIFKTTNAGGEFVGIASISNNIPERYTLFQNYPNPFNSETLIEFQIFKNGYTRMDIYNALGQLIETPVKQEMNSGTYQIKWSAGNYSSGIYFYQLSTGNYIETKKMLMVK